VDVLLVLPFLIDTVGNALDLYDTVGWWDDANHLVNWAILVSAAGRALVRLPLGPLTVAGLAVGFGAVTAVLWELASTSRSSVTHPSSTRPTRTPSATSASGLTGSVLAAGLAAWTVRRRAVTANEH
jgi:hypothetical protein